MRYVTARTPYTGNQLYRQPGGQAARANQLYRQPEHRQSVTQAAQAEASSYTGNPSTGNQLYRQPKNRQAQATSYTGSPSTGNQLYRQRFREDSLRGAALVWAWLY